MTSNPKCFYLFFLFSHMKSLFNNYTQEKASNRNIGWLSKRFYYSLPVIEKINSGFNMEWIQFSPYQFQCHSFQLVFFLFSVQINTKQAERMEVGEKRKSIQGKCDFVKRYSSDNWYHLPMSILPCIREIPFSKIRHALHSLRVVDACVYYVIYT